MIHNHPNRKGFNRDGFYMLSRDEVAQHAHQTLNSMNRLQGHELLGAVSLLFATVCSRCNMDPQEAHKVGMRIMLDQEELHVKTNDAIQSLRDFAGIQVMGEEVDTGTGKGVVIA